MAENFESFAAFFPHPFVLLTRTGRIVAANPAAARMGLRASASLHDMVARPDELAAYLDLCLRVSSPVPGRLELKTGSPGRWRTHGARWGGARVGEPLAVLRFSAGADTSNAFGQLTRRIETLNREIRLRRVAEDALRESEEKLRLLADTIPQLAWMARADGHIFWYNRRWYEYTGTSPQEMEGWGWQSVHHPDVLPEVLTRWKGSLASGEPFEMVFPLRGADGEFRPFLTRVRPLRDPAGRILYWFGTNTDVAEIKRLEDELRNADRRKTEFLATLAHELRNPLAPIRNALELIRIGSGQVADEARAIIERQVRHMVRLVDDLMDVSRITSGKLVLHPERLALQEVIAQAVEATRPQLHGHEFTLSLPAEPVHVRADAVRLAQVVSNLLNNACKYTPKGGSIRLSVERSDGYAVIRVKDLGIGIAREQLNRVFDMFSQLAPALERTQEGLGIGLSLARALARMHGGDIEADSAGPGQGSEFRVRLPLSREVESARASQAPADWHKAVTARRILVVDDNRDAADSLSALLRAEGNEVQAVYDGLEALEKAPGFAPDAILLDIGMPKMNGYETCRRIRREPWGNGAVVIALSGWGQEEDRAKSREAGFDEHLIKPVDPSVLAKTLAYLLLQKKGDQGGGAVSLFLG